MIASDLTAPAPSPVAMPDAGRDEVQRLKTAVVEKLAYAVGKRPAVASPRDWYMATALAVRDRMVDPWFQSTRDAHSAKGKRVYYLSMEFLIGRLLLDALTNLGLTAAMRTALSELGVELDDLRKLEPDAALGNGGLGRLAACFMESMATLSVPAYGYGIRYDHGLFRQVIRDGWQQEYPETWLSFGNPWEFERAEVAYTIGFGGSVDAIEDDAGEVTATWTPGETVQAVGFDTPIVGWRGRHVNTLRLWSARPTEPLSLAEFNSGEHLAAVASRARAESISQVLYPSDETPAGEELRLRQEFFFSSAALQDIVRRHLNHFDDLLSLPDHVSIQLNDTHPAISVAELMRLLVDVHGLDWKTAWSVTERTFSYTNHTLQPEALESWSVPLMERLLPRHMQIIYLINEQHLNALRDAGQADDGLFSAVSLIDEHGPRRVRMAWLSFLGSHHVNGVSALHTELMRETVFSDLHRLYPRRIVNKTNGIVFRRWLFEANPGLTRLLVDTVGPQVMDDPTRLEGFADFADDAAVHERYRAVRRGHKAALAGLIRERTGVRVDPDAMFDVHIKRIHEYKRQLLNILETVALYDAMRAQPMRNWVPRVKIFAGKAAASYHRAKLIIKLINDVARTVNRDPTLRGRLKVVFLPDYNVSLAEAIIPAADVSEQISTASTEASGTGNMKLALNGALTIGTRDGANVELEALVGSDHIFTFGLSAGEVGAKRDEAGLAREYVARSPALQQVLEQIGSGVFSPSEPDRYRGLVESLLSHDYFMVTADFDDFAATQRRLAQRWREPGEWWRSAVLNTANVGWFSSDRTIREYAEEIWNVPVRA